MTRLTVALLLCVALWLLCASPADASATRLRRTLRRAEADKHRVEDINVTEALKKLGEKAKELGQRTYNYFFGKNGTAPAPGPAPGPKDTPLPPVDPMAAQPPSPPYPKSCADVPGATCEQLATCFAKGGKVKPGLCKSKKGQPDTYCCVGTGPARTAATCKPPASIAAGLLDVWDNDAELKGNMDAIVKYRQGKTTKGWDEAAVREELKGRWTKTGHKAENGRQLESFEAYFNGKKQVDPCYLQDAFEFKMSIFKPKFYLSHMNRALYDLEPRTYGNNPMKFSKQPASGFEAEVQSPKVVGGSDKQPVGLSTLALVAEAKRLAAAEGLKISGSTYVGHSWNAYSIDWFVDAPIMGDGFYQRDKLVRAMQVVDKAVQNLNALCVAGKCESWGWRGLYNDYAATDALHKSLKSRRIGWQYNHGPDPYVLHFHTDHHPGTPICVRNPQHSVCDMTQYGQTPTGTKDKPSGALQPVGKDGTPIKTQP